VEERPAVKVDRRSLRKKSPEKPRSRPKPHRSVLKMRREAGKAAWKTRQKKGTDNYKMRRTNGRPAGVSDGMRKAEADVAWAVARASAKETIAKMIENKVIEPSDDQRANEALEVAMTIMKGPSAHQAEKLRAARVVLEWTRAKPAAKSEVTIQKAEDWLALVTADAAKDQ
jgi:hypothetical protein